jgi:hypothetical protein
MRLVGSMEEGPIRGPTVILLSEREEKPRSPLNHFFGRSMKMFEGENTE